MCAPGASAYRDPSRMQDMVCTAAAGCDLAIADDKFRLTKDRASGTGMIPALQAMYRRALQDFPSYPETAGLLAIMEYQSARMIAAKLQVRLLCATYGHSAALGVQGCS